MKIDDLGLPDTGERDSCRRGHKMTVENSYKNNGYLLCRSCRRSASIKSREINTIEITCISCGTLKKTSRKTQRFCTELCAAKSSQHREIHKTHGLTYAPEYNVWLSMKRRCTKEKSSDYKYYGGRGIKVCEEWLKSFESFYKDMSPRPSDRYSLDRIDVNGNYEPSNCRWATHKTQMINTRTKANSSGYRGVLQRKNSYSSRCSGKHLGTFKDAIGAALAYDKYVYANYGITSGLNFPALKIFKKDVIHAI